MRGVSYVNDSIATAPERTLAALRSNNKNADLWVYDTQVQGFAVRMRRGKKAFYFRWKANGKDYPNNLPYRS